MNKAQTPVTTAVLQAGIVSSEVIDEMNRWGLPVKFVETPRFLNTLEDIVDCLREAVESDENVKLRDTELDAMNFYLAHNKPGKLTFRDQEADRNVSVQVQYAVTPGGRYLIPWTDESIVDKLVDQGTTLNAGGKKVAFEEVEELFFGGVKAFVSAKPVTEGASHG
jgi:hypothetical protein